MKPKLFIGSSSESLPIAKAESLPVPPREAEILFRTTQGKTDAVIQLLCGISPRTVHKHVDNIFTKLGVESGTAAMLRAFEVL